MAKTTIFLTGATGTMGWQGMKEILQFPENYNLRILARPSKKNKSLLAPLADKVEIIWGDLTNADDVLRGVTGSDIVLHVGGAVSPFADYHRDETIRVNLTAAKNIREAILAQGDKQPKLVYIGSVAQYGFRPEPHNHWGRTGDPIRVSKYDHYGVTKVMAERILTDGGIKCWVSLRQSGILYPAILRNYDPIMFHVPIRGVLEWATVEDSGRLLEHVCRPDVPEEFWCRYYNIGSGDEYRISNYRFEELLLGAIGCPNSKKIFRARWFATQNFHGMWYADGDVLENYLHFRANIPVEEYFRAMAKADSLPIAIKFASVTKIAKLFPHCVKAAMWACAMTPKWGTQWWVKHNITERLDAFYGGREAFESIPEWDGWDLTEPTKEQELMDHGYDENKPMAEFDIQDMQAVASFRGGKCISKTMTKGDWDTQLEWEDADGTSFMASPRLVLFGGHWTPLNIDNF